MFNPNSPDSAEVLAKLICEEVGRAHLNNESMIQLSTHLAQFTWERSARVLVDAVSAKS